MNLKEGYTLGQDGLCMLVHESPEVYLIKVPYPNITTNSTNCYAICDGGECLVVDTGAPSAEGRSVMEGALKLIGANSARTSFFLTHLHKDHAGMVDWLVPRERPLYVGARDYALNLERMSAAYAHKAYERFVAEGIDAEHAQRYTAYKTSDEDAFSADRDLRLVKPGDEIRVGDCVLQIVDTAGHTPGHLSLYEPESGVFFGGDHVLFVVSPVLELSQELTGVMDTYLASLDRTVHMDISSYYHSHGPLKPGWRERALHLADHHKRRLDEVAMLVSAKPGMTGDQIIKNIRWSAKIDPWDEVPAPLQWCIVSEGLVVIDCLVERGVIERCTDNSGIRTYFAAS